MRTARTATTVTAIALVISACGQPAPTASDPPAPAASPAAPAATPTDPAGDAPQPDSDATQGLVAGLNAVGYDLFGVAAADADDDVVLSPLSIGIAFGMADAGASGATAEVLADLFAYPVDGEERWAAFHTIEQSVTDVGAPVVRLANRMFPDTGFTTAEGYDETLTTWFGAGVEPLPLQADPEGSRAHINDWVAERTEDLIPDLLPPGFVNERSVLVLVNALYLEARWATPFGKYPTEQAPFTRLDGSEVMADLMVERELSGPAVAADDYAATEIAYEDGELSMLVIVPADGRYADIEARLDADLVAEIDDAAQSGTVALWLPRFDSDTTLDLRQAIEGDLGVDELFGVHGWDGIAPDITLQSAVHAAEIAVDEEGTVAAASTALGFEESGPGEPDVTVRADRPFLYLIRHVPTGAVLFVGRVLDPSS